MSTKWISSPRVPTLVVGLDGELDATRRDEIIESCLRTDANVVLDLSHVSFVDSRGYDALIDARRAVRGQGRDCMLVNVAPTVQRHLTLIARAAAVTPPD